MQKLFIKSSKFPNIYKELSTKQTLENIVSLLKDSTEFEFILSVYLMDENGLSGECYKKENDDFSSIIRFNEWEYYSDFVNNLPKDYQSINIFKKLVFVAKSSFDLNVLLRSFRKYFELSKDKLFIKLDNNYFKSFIDYGYQPYSVVILRNNDCIAILGTDQENEDFNEDFGITFSENPITIKELVSLVTKDKSCEVYLIDHFVGKSKEIVKYSKHSAYQTIRKSEKRNELLEQIIYLKAINESFDLEKAKKLIFNDKHAVKLFMENTFLAMNSYLVNRKKNYKIISLDSTISDYEYDAVRDRFYFEINSTIQYIGENQEIKNYKYNSILPSAIRLKNPTPEKLLVATLLKTTCGYANGFSRVFINDRDAIEVNNYYTNGFDKTYIDKYLTNIPSFGIVLTREFR